MGLMLMPPFRFYRLREFRFSGAALFFPVRLIWEGRGRLDQSCHFLFPLHSRNVLNRKAFSRLRPSSLLQVGISTPSPLKQECFDRRDFSLIIYSLPPPLFGKRIFASVRLVIVLCVPPMKLIFGACFLQSLFPESLWHLRNETSCSSGLLSFLFLRPVRKSGE